MGAELSAVQRGALHNLARCYAQMQAERHPEYDWIVEVREGDGPDARWVVAATATGHHAGGDARLEV